MYCTSLGAECTSNKSDLLEDCNLVDPSESNELKSKGYGKDEQYPRNHRSRHLFDTKGRTVVVAVHQNETCRRPSVRHNASIRNSVSSSCTTYPRRKISSCSSEVHRGI